VAVDDSAWIRAVGAVGNGVVLQLRALADASGVTSASGVRMGLGSGNGRPDAWATTGGMGQRRPDGTGGQMGQQHACTAAGGSSPPLRPPLGTP
jgi:hypothetical protein